MSNFSDIKDAMATQLAALFTAASLSVTIRKYRTLDWSSARDGALLVLASAGFGESGQLQDSVDVIVSVIVPYGNETEASAAETLIDNIDQELIDAYRSDGTHQKAAGIWSAVNFFQPSFRLPASRDEATWYYYSQSHLRFWIV
jgi:hypothetical protein